MTEALRLSVTSTERHFDVRWGARARSSLLAALIIIIIIIFTPFQSRITQKRMHEKSRKLASASVLRAIGVFKRVGEMRKKMTRQRHLESQEN